MIKKCQSLLYILELIRSKLINHHHNNLLAGYFGIDKVQELITKKYYQLTFHYNIEIYIRRCNMCLVFKTIYYKSYGNLQSLPVPTYSKKDLLIDFVIDLSLSADQKYENYKLILVIVNRLTKMVYYKFIKITINTLKLMKIIINMVIQYHGLPDSIINNCRAIFMSMFWSLLYYFFTIKKQLFIMLYPQQIDGQNHKKYNKCTSLCFFKLVIK